MLAHNHMQTNKLPFIPLYFLRGVITIHINWMVIYNQKGILRFILTSIRTTLLSNNIKIIKLIKKITVLPINNPLNQINYKKCSFLIF